jgi:OST3 / OST6 family, transporter family
MDAFVKSLAAATGVEVKLLHDMSFLNWTAYALAVIAGVVANIIIPKPTRAITLARNKQLWLIISIAVYTLGVGGFVYCFIRKPRSFAQVQGTAPGQATKLILFSTGGRYDVYTRIMCICYCR